MADAIKKAYDADLDLSGAERTLVCTMTTDAVDSYGEVILPKGIDLAGYRKNPVVLWGHNLLTPPIGKALWIKPSEDKRGLLAKVQFAETEAAEEIWALYRDGFLKSFSIGARGVEGSPPTPAEIRARPELAECHRVWRKIVLQELSAVSVGANKEALAIAVGKGLALSAPIRKALGLGDEAPAGPEPEPTKPSPELPPLVGRTFEQVHQELLRSVRGHLSGDVARGLLMDEYDRIRGRV